MSEQIHPWDTLACCWDIKQPTNKQQQQSDYGAGVLGFKSELSHTSHLNIVTPGVTVQKLGIMGSVLGLVGLV